jgi:MFS family permease
MVEGETSAASSGQERRAIFCICVLKLFTAALANAVRAGTAGAIKARVFDPIDPRHSGAMIATVLGSSFLGFAFALLLVSPLLDRVGAHRTIVFAALCYVLGPALVLLAAQAGGHAIYCSIWRW